MRLGVFLADVATLLGLGLALPIALLPTSPRVSLSAYLRATHRKPLFEEEAGTQGLNSSVGITTKFIVQFVHSHQLRRPRVYLTWAGLVSEDLVQIAATC